MKYLKYFTNESDYQTFKDSEDYVLPNVSYAVDTDKVFYHVVKTETGDYKIFLLEKKNISELTYNMVDLGLPSGTLWADRNVGASSPEDFGTNFAWGETEGYNTSIVYCTAAELCAYAQPMIGDEMILTPDNIDEFFAMAGFEGTDLTVKGTGFGIDKCFSRDWSDYFDTTDGGSTFNKYNSNGGFTVLDSSDDAATVHMGSDYRMPTETEMKELTNNTTVTFVDLQGNEFSLEEAENGSIAEYNFKGIKLTGDNGNFIFIPASGHCENSNIVVVSLDGSLWSSSLNSTRVDYAYHVRFDFGGYLKVGWDNRCRGMAIRGVCNK